MVPPRAEGPLGCSNPLGYGRDGGRERERNPLIKTTITTKAVGNSLSFLFGLRALFELDKLNF